MFCVSTDSGMWFVYHGRGHAAAGASSDLYWELGEGWDMLGRPTRQVLSPEWSRALRWMATALETHPDARLIDQNLDARLRWCETRNRELGIIFAAADFYRDVLGAFCPEMLSAFLEMIRAEPILYADAGQSPYREHIAHPIFVFLAGRRILDQPQNLLRFASLSLNQIGRHADFLRGIGGRISRAQPCCSAIAANWDDEWNRLLANPNRQCRVIRIAWLLTALCHDLGYTVSHATKRVHAARTDALPLRNLPTWAGSPELSEFLNDSLFVSDLRQRHREYASDADISKTLAESVLRNHSFGSALILLGALRLVMQRVGVNPHLRGDFLDLMVAWELAADAIALHDLDTPQKAGAVRNHLAFEVAPLAWLLRTMDLLQEWDRPVQLPDRRYAIPFEGVAITVEQTGRWDSRVTGVHRLVNSSLVDATCNTVSLNAAVCAAADFGYWADYSRPRPEPPCAEAACPIAPVFTINSEAGLRTYYELQCRGQVPRLPLYPYTNADDVGSVVVHERCYRRFWPESLRDYLNTGDNATTLAKLLTGG